MATIEIHKTKFKEYLKQFVDDVPYEIELVKTLLDQIPPNAVEGFITEYFYTHGYFKGTLYKIQHLIQHDDIRYFTDMSSLCEYLRQFSLDKRIRESLTEKNLAYFIRIGQPISGYLITEVKQ